MPLIFLLYLNNCKNKMKQIISESISKYLSVYHENDFIFNMIIDFIFVDYNKFYNLEIQNNVKVKSMVFMAHLFYLGMDQVIVD